MSSALRPSACARFLKALADPEWLCIVDPLCYGPRHVSELAAELRGELANVSLHLGVLTRLRLFLHWATAGKLQAKRGFE